MMESPLASQHFRNQIKLVPDARATFEQIVADTWPGVRVRRLDEATGEPSTKGVPGKPTLTLLVQNDDFVAEAAHMGHGLQMWLQTMWFLARTPADATVILDEPDVYMHPDLQRRLVRLLWRRHAQVVVATHSAEIMAEVEPEDVLVVERARPRSNFAPSLPAVQKLIDALGGVHNLQLARLWSARRFLMVEGDDLALLGPIHASLFPTAVTASQSLPHGDVGGWSGLDRAIGSAATLRNAVGQEITAYCLFDSDYFPPTVLAQRYSRAAEGNLQLHIWRRKEIENYLLVPPAIARVIAARAPDGQPRPTVDDIAAEIDRIADSMRVDTVASMATEVQKAGKGVVAGTAYKEAEKRLTAGWADREEGRWGRVCGKDVLSTLSRWSKGRYGASFSPTSIAHALQPTEVPQELREVLAAIEHGTPLPPNALHGT